MRLDRLRQCYGRKAEIEYLQRIFDAILAAKQGDDSSSTVATEVTTPSNSTSSTVDDGRIIDSCLISDDCCSHQDTPVGSNCRLILISGRNGSGKLALAYEALEMYRVSKKRCHKASFLQVSGQFRAYQENIRTVSPYTSGRSKEFDNSLSAFHDAFSEIMPVLLQDFDTSHAILDHLKSLLKDPKDAVVLTKVFPCLKKLFLLDPFYHVNGDSPELYCNVFLRGTPSAADRLQVLCRSIVSFFLAVSSCVPLVFVLEDLQNADAAALVLIAMLMNVVEDVPSTPQSKGLFIVATYVRNEGEPISDPLKSFLQKDMGDSMEICTPFGLSGSTQAQKILHLSLSNLTWDDLHEWTQNADGIIQRLNVDQKRAVTNLLFHHTSGNPLHARYLLQYLHPDKSLLSDPIHKQRIPSTMAALYTIILLRHDSTVIHVVQCVALLSHLGEMKVVDCDMLKLAMMKPCVDELLQAHESGLLDYFPVRGYVRFRCDDLQMAAYKTIPDSGVLHFEIGLNLWKEAIRLRDQGMGTYDTMKRTTLLAILHLRNLDYTSLDYTERLQMSKYFYEFGLHSSQLGDLVTSAKCFEFAIYVLRPELWRPDLYETCLVLHNAAVQAYFHTCDFDNMEQTLDAIFRNARSLGDSIPAYIVLVYAKAKGQMKEGFRIISEVLDEMREPINPKPSAFTLIKSSFGVKWSLLGRDFDFLSNLPDANEDNLVVTHFLSFAMIFMNIVLPDTSFLLGSCLIRFSIKHGVTGPAAVAFAQYAFVLSAMGKWDLSYRFCQLSLIFADRFEVWRPRIYLYVYGLTNFWTRPLRDSVNPLHQGQLDAIKYGDMQSYGMLAGFSIFVLLRLGASLKRIQSDAHSFCRSLAEMGQLNPLFMILPMWSVINDLTGRREILHIPGEIQNSEIALKLAAKEGAIILLAHSDADRALFYFLIGEYQESLEMTRKAHEHRNIFDFNVPFYECLAKSALAWTLNSRKKRNSINHCRKLAKRMRKWADRCPANFLNKQLLMDAEIAAIKGKSALALSLYEKSASKAKMELLLHEEGIAYERLGRYQLHLGNIAGAKRSLECSRNAFEKWGADIVVKRIEMFMASINEK